MEIIWSSLVNLENVQSNLKKERKVGPVTPVEVSQRHLGLSYGNFAVSDRTFMKRRSLTIKSSCFPELKIISSRKIIVFSFLLLLIMYVYCPVIIIEVNT